MKMEIRLLGFVFQIKKLFCIKIRTCVRGSGGDQFGRLYCNHLKLTAFVSASKEGGKANEWV